ncbi:MAG: hypothetical protein WD652_04110 [Acidimicrobiia bacterium]
MLPWGAAIAAIGIVVTLVGNAMQGDDATGRELLSGGVMLGIGGILAIIGILLVIIALFRRRTS